MHQTGCRKRKRLDFDWYKEALCHFCPNKTNRPRLKDILEKNPDVEMPDYVLSRIKGKYRDMPIIVDPEDSAAMAPTCVAHYSKDLGTRLVKDTNSNME